LTLLEKKLNKEAGVLPYRQKKITFDKSSCILTKKIPENYDSWNEDKVSARQKDLAKAAKSIWIVQELS